MSAATAAEALALAGVAAPPQADSEQRRALVEMAGEIARRELTPMAARLDGSEEKALAACWRIICEVGLDRALVRVEAGGAGIGERDLLSVVEELAVGDGGTALAVLLSNVALAALPSERAAAVPAGARWAAVPLGWGARIARAEGRVIEVCAPALGAYGTDGVVLVFPAEAGRCSVLYAERPAPELLLARDEHQLGLGGAPAAAVTFAAGHRDGAPDGRSRDGDGGAGGIGGGRVMESPCPLDLIRRGAAAIARGIARRAEEIAREYAHARRQGGVAIVEHDAVRDMLSAMALRRLSLSGAGERPAAQAAQAAGDALAIAEKIAAADAAVASTIDAVQVLGGIGYMRPTGVEKLMRDAQCIALYPEPGWVAQDVLVRAAS